MSGGAAVHIGGADAAWETNLNLTRSPRRRRRGRYAPRESVRSTQVPAPWTCPVYKEMKWNDAGSLGPPGR